MFFKSAQDALLASYRPCKRCKPLSHPDEVSDLVRFLVEAVEEEPTKRWKTLDLFSEIQEILQNTSITAKTISHIRRSDIILLEKII